MKSVLIVDDEKPFLESVKLGFLTYESDFKLYTAGNGKEAIDILESQAIDIIVTDVKMPVMDGFELLAHISDKYPSTPVIVMSAYADTEMNKKIMHMGSLGLLEKPLNFDDLATMVKNWLQMTSKNESINGISLESFLQLIELEQTTYLLKIFPRNREESVGFIYAFNGELYDAIYGELKGEEAVFEILSWDNPRISVKKSPLKKFKKTIRRSIMSILLEASTQKDESKGERQEAERSDFEKAKYSGDEDKNDKITQGAGEVTTTKVSAKTALKNYLDTLQSIKGYKASAVMTHTGAMIASDTVDTIIQPEDTCVLFNDVLIAAHEACKKSGFEIVGNLVIRSPHGKVMMLCSGARAKIHFHLVVITATESNLELVEMSLEKIASKIIEKRWVND